MHQKKVVNFSLESHQFQHESCRAAYFDRGSGIPIVMLHGFMGEASDWNSLSEIIGDRYRCIALDLLGFGESEKPRIQYDIAIEVAFVRRFVETLDLDPFYLLGHSFGAWVSSAYTLQFPEFVKGLILAGPAGIRDDRFCGRYDYLRPLFWETPIIDWGLNIADGVSRAIGKKAEIEKIKWYRRELMNQPVARSFLASRLRPEDAIDTVENEIYQIAQPTLVIAGELDETIPLWHSQTYADKIPNAELVVIPGADHSLPQKYAPQMAEAIEHFLGG